MDLFYSAVLYILCIIKQYPVVAIYTEHDDSQVTRSIHTAYIGSEIIHAVYPYCVDLAKNIHAVYILCYLSRQYVYWVFFFTQYTYWVSKIAVCILGAQYIYWATMQMGCNIYTVRLPGMHPRYESAGSSSVDLQALSCLVYNNNVIL